MKHTDFRTQLENIKKQEIQELSAAVAAHGGEVTFNMEAGDKAPIITYNLKSAVEEGAVEVIIKTVTLEGDRLRIYGNVKNDYYADVEEEFFIEYFLPGQLSFIIDAIPEKEPTPKQ